jgi:hypothetical protein
MSGSSMSLLLGRSGVRWGEHCLRAAAADFFFNCNYELKVFNESN